jgi:ubiquinone/menaquinone biosynthesis C-methylase UbiE
MQAKSLSLDWQDWLERWDRQQSGHVPDREQRFQAMLDVLEVMLPADFTAIDLASGPGSLSKRLLARFPHAQCVAVDIDPVLLTLGRGALGDMQGRLRWIEGDLRDVGWIAQLGQEQVDAVLSTTALHWLPVESLIQLYGRLGQLIRPGGIVLNGDHFTFGPHMPTFAKVVRTMREHKEASAFSSGGLENWRTWWDALAREPGMAELFAERERRFAWRGEEDIEPIVELHEVALRHAGFREVGVLWQNLDNRILMAVR